MSTKIEEALDSQAELLNKFSAIVRSLLKLVATLKADKDAAVAQLASLLGVDESGASAILEKNPEIQALIDEASAALPSNTSNAPIEGAAAS
ncbi:MAG: hypothetical protein V7K47_06825 [Nostoc sp.]